jgi:hypothetical protein
MTRGPSMRFAAGFGAVAVVHREHGPAILRLAVASVAGDIMTR